MYPQTIKEIKRKLQTSSSKHCQVDVGIGKQTGR